MPEKIRNEIYVNLIHNKVIALTLLEIRAITFVKRSFSPQN